MSLLHYRLALAAMVGILSCVATGILAPHGVFQDRNTPQFMSAIKLAERIKNRESIQVIDLRDSAAFAEFNLPRSRRLSIAQALAAQMEGDRVYYSGQDLLARKLWASLPDSVRARSYVLHGGVEAWYQQVLHPTLPRKPRGEDRPLVQHLNALIQFYGGEATFTEDSTVLDVYRVNLSNAPWPKTQLVTGEMRKGC